jgi:peptidyl-tRNA hydrolase
MDINKDQELIQYYIINTSIGMSYGKITAQIAHASMIAALSYHQEPLFQTWKDICMKKIMLQANTHKLQSLKECGFITIQDAGFNEIEPNSLTVTVLPIKTRAEAQMYVKGLQLFHYSKEDEL